MRTLLFVPADSERKLQKAADAGADALAFDLEDSVLPARKAAARGLLSEYLQSYSGSSEVWVRVNDLASGELLKDLAALIPFAPAGIVLPKIRGPEDVDIVSAYLDMTEAIQNRGSGSTRIIPVGTETPSAVLRLGEFLAQRRSRLAGMIWGAEDLSAAIGAGDPRMADGSWRPTYEFARAQCLLACHALEVEAIDTVFVDIRNNEGCRLSAEAARLDGFTGKVAIHPDQVAIINAAFMPTTTELEYARRVVAAFDGNEGAVSLDGKMLDIPHLKTARRTLLRAGAHERTAARAP